MRLRGFCFVQMSYSIFLNVSSTNFIFGSCQFRWSLCFCTYFVVSFVGFGVGIGIDLGWGWFELTGSFFSNLFNSWIVLLSPF